ncbi:MAG: hypothetical protein E6Q97_11210 [Desulfurellales bacterium]|nr:MAG: hypothetical protein E6Q97_11210 [Desulfurellales bacterium]
MTVTGLCAFINERENIRVKKELGVPRAQWTKDPILATYRFCNVRRNDDRVTRWIHENWLSGRGPWDADNEDMWFAMVVARLFNLPKTLDAIEHYVLPCKPADIRRVLRKRREKHPIFNGAYIVSTNGRAMDKLDYVLDVVLAPIWKQRKRLRPLATDSLDIYHTTLVQCQGLGSFMAAQVVADLKYTAPLNQAKDWQYWAASGPGSRRGLNRVMGRPVDANWTEARWREDFRDLWNLVNGTLRWEIPLTGQDLQNCLCEFDKYERARLGEGKPKQLYKGERV